MREMRRYDPSPPHAQTNNTLKVYQRAVKAGTDPSEEESGDRGHSYEGNEGTQAQYCKGKGHEGTGEPPEGRYAVTGAAEVALPLIKLKSMVQQHNPYPCCRKVQERGHVADRQGTKGRGSTSLQENRGPGKGKERGKRRRKGYKPLSSTFSKHIASPCRRGRNVKNP